MILYEDLDKENFKILENLNGEKPTPGHIEVDK